MKTYPEMPPLDAPIILEEVVGKFERQLIMQALEECDGVQTRAAERLGTTRRILRYRMDKLGIPISRSQIESSSCQTPGTP